MIKKRRAHTVLYGFLLWISITSLGPVPTYAQLLNFNLKIEAKTSTSSMQRMMFGLYPINSGWVKAQFGSRHMGILRIATLEGQTVLMNLHHSEALSKNEDFNTDQVPLSVRARYGFDFKNYNNSFPFTKDETEITIQSAQRDTAWQTLYIFLYGAINIGNISSGIYSGDVSITINFI